MATTEPSRTNLSGHLADMQCRWQAGDRPRVEDYIQAHPELRENAEVVKDLIYQEYCLREQAGEAPRVEECLDRFPQFRDALRRLFEIHAAMRSNAEPSGAHSQRTDDLVTPTFAAGDTSGLPDPNAKDCANDSAKAAIPNQRFTWIRLHAEGGLGRVSIALDTELGRKVAFKQIRPERADNPISRQRFVREAKLTGMLEHPGIVPVYSLGKDTQGQPYYAMRLIEGESLAEAIAAFHQSGRKPLTLRQLLTRFVAVCNSIEYAHNQGIIHRDLKPANIMLGKYGETLVVDWGLAKTIGSPSAQHATSGLPMGEDSLSRSGERMGTPAYMSPEQAAGNSDEMGCSSDIYSLGATLYHLVKGHPPVKSTNEGDRIGAAIPRALESICRKAMNLTPEDRYASAKNLSDEVERFLADEKVLAHRETLLQRTNRWTRKHRVWTQAGLAAMVLVTIISILAAVMVNKSRLAAVKESLRADANFEMARNAVDEYLTRVSESNLLNVPRLEPLRKELLELALQYYQHFIEQKEDDEKTQKDLADAFGRVAKIQQELGRQELALDAFENQIRLYNVLRRQSPEPSYEVVIATAYHGLGSAQKALGRSNDAILSYQNAMEIREKLATKFADVPDYRNALASACTVLAVLQAGLENHTQASALHQKAIGIVDKLFMDDPKKSEYRYGVVAAYLQYGFMQESLGNWQRAKELYEKAVTVGDVLLRENLSSSTLNTFARLHHHQGKTHSRLGNLTLATEEFNKSVDVLTRCVEEHPDLPHFRESLLDVYHDLGLLQEKLGEIKSAITTHELESHEAKHLVDEYPEIPTYRYRLAVVLDQLGWLHRRHTKELETGGRMIRESISHLERLVSDQPHNPAYQSKLAGAYKDLGLLQRDTGQFEASKDSHQKAVAILSRLVNDHPDVPEYLGDLAGAHNNIGRLYGVLNQPSEAIDAYTRALEIRERLVRANPLDQQFALDLAENLMNLGDISHRNSQAAAAVEWFQKAILKYQEILNRNHQLATAKRSLRDSQANLALSLSSLGRAHDAIGQADSLLKSLGEASLTKDDGKILYAFASMFSNYAALAERRESIPKPGRDQAIQEFSARAVCLLKQAQSAGYFDNPTNVERLKNDSNLDSLRELADFKQLLDEVTNK